MSDFLGVVLFLEDGHRLGGGDVDWFEKVQPPGDRVAFAFSLTGQDTKLSDCAARRFERGRRREIEIKAGPYEAGSNPSRREGQPEMSRIRSRYADHLMARQTELQLQPLTSLPPLLTTLPRR